VRRVFFFFCLPKRRNKKKAPVSLVPPLAGFPALLKAAGMLQTRCAQTVQPPFSAAFPVLGGVPMGNIRKRSLLIENKIKKGGQR
jgi:hypothetical protein